MSVPRIALWIILCSAVTLCFGIVLTLVVAATVLIGHSTHWLELMAGILDIGGMAGLALAGGIMLVRLIWRVWRDCG